MNDFSRRKFLRDVAWAVPSAAITGVAPAELNTQGRTEQKKLKVIVAGGHPGDPEYGCGGAVARSVPLS